MTKIYVVYGSEDGNIAAYTSKKKAIARAIEYVTLSYDFKRSNESKIARKDMGNLIIFSCNSGTIQANIEIYEG